MTINEPTSDSQIDMKNEINMISVEDFFSITDDGFMIVDRVGKILSLNHRWEDIIELPSSETIGKFLWDIDELLWQYKSTDPIDINNIKSKVLMIFDDMIEHNKKVNSNVRIITKTGKTKYLNRILAPVIKSSSIFFAVIIKDNTEITNAENEKKAAEYKYKMLFEKMLDGFAIHEMIYNESNQPIDYRFLDINASFEKLTGLYRDEIINKTVMEVMPATEKYWLHTYNYVLESEEPLTFINFSGELDKWYQVTAFKTDEKQFATIFEDITEKIKYEKELSLSEKRFRSFLENLNFISVILDTSGEILFCNKYLLDVTHWQSEEIINQNWFQIFCPGNNDLIEQFKRAINLEKFKSQIENNIVTKYGDELTILWSNSIIRDETGNIKEISCIGENITARLDAEKAVYESEAKYRMLFEKSSMVVYDYDINSAQIIWSGDTFGLLGYEHQEIQDYNVFGWESLLHPDDLNESVNLLEHSINTGADFDHIYRLKRKSGEYIYIEDNGVVFSNSFGVSVRMLGTLRNVTDKLMTQREILNHQLRLKSILDNIPYLAWMKDTDGKYVAVNKEYLNYSNLEEENIIGKTDDVIWPPEFAEKYKIDDKIVVDSKKQSFMEEELYSNNGVVWLETFKAPIFDDKGSVVGTTGISRDITEHRKMEKELIKARDEADAANIAKSQFLANMSHEIRTPMNGILGFLELLALTEIDEEQAEFISLAKNASHSLLNIINDILDFSKIEAGRLRMDNVSFDLIDLLESTAILNSPRAAEKGLALNMYLEKGLPFEVIADSGRLKQIINNLLTNAVKFTDSGEVNLEVRINSQTEEYFELYVEVRDTGIGIPKEEGGKLFESFSMIDSTTTRKHGGTGLGLAISKKLVEAMGGQIGFYSTLGFGSKFYFTVKLKKTKIETTNILSKYSKIAGKIALIVSSNGTNNEYISEYLKEINITAVIFSEPLFALSYIFDNLFTEHKVDFIILSESIEMMTSDDFIKALKGYPPLINTGIIMLRNFSGIQHLKQNKNNEITIYNPTKKYELFNTILSMYISDEKPKDNEIISTVLSNSSNANSGLDNYKILLAEDNELNRNFVTKLLEKMGLKCEVAKDGLEAVALSKAKKYDLIIMDCQMPNLDGFEATSEIRAGYDLNKKTPIVAMTAYAMEGDKEKCLDAGMTDYLTKPINFKQLGSMLDTYLYSSNVIDNHSENIQELNPELEAILKEFMENTNLDKEDGIEFINLFLSTLKDNLADIKQKISEDDFINAKKITHTVLGTAANLRINKLIVSLQNLESAESNHLNDISFKILDEINAYSDLLFTYMQDA